MERENEDAKAGRCTEREIVDALSVGDRNKSVRRARRGSPIWFSQDGSWGRSGMFVLYVTLKRGLLLVMFYHMVPPAIEEGNAS